MDTQKNLPIFYQSHLIVSVKHQSSFAYGVIIHKVTYLRSVSSQSQSILVIFKAQTEHDVKNIMC